MLKVVDTTISVTEVVGDGMTGDVTEAGSSTGDSEVVVVNIDSASDVDVAEGELSTGGVDSPDGKVEVTVLPARVLVSVCVEVEYKVVVGSAPAPPPSRLARDARGKERRTEVSRRRMIVGYAPVVRSGKDRDP